MSSNLSVLALGGDQFSFHRFEDAGPLLADGLESALVDVTLTTDREALTDLSAHDVVLDYTTDSTLSDAQRAGLLSFVRDGGGYLGLHCAADLTSTVADDPDAVLDSRDEPFPELRELVGGHFLTHPEQTTYDVRIVDSYHPITASLDDLRVWDEPYVVDVDDSVRVLARMDHPEYADVPVVWVKEYGDGRVCYCSLGHTESTLTDASVRELLGRAVRWVGAGT